MDNWKERAEGLFLNTRLSYRQIGEAVSQPKSTVYDHISKLGLSRGEPNVLIADIETSPEVSYHWRRWKENIHKDQVIRTSHLICWSAKWLGSNEIMFDSQHLHDSYEPGTEDDWGVAASMLTLFNKADIVVFHNGNRFDIKVLKTRWASNGLPQPTPYQAVDTYRIAKREFRFPSNSLASIAEYLGLESKMDHEGFRLWRSCIEGDLDAWDRMVEYNKQDVRVLEDVYKFMRPWDRSHPNVALYQDNDEVVCTRCGSSDIEFVDGAYYYTKTNRYVVYKCKEPNCGAYSRERLGDKSTSQRKNVLTPSR